MAKLSRKRDNDSALTDDEIAFLRSDRTPYAIRQYASRQHESIGLRVSAFRKVAAAAKAEREALLEVAALGVVRMAMEGTSRAEDRVSALEEERRILASELDRTRTRLLEATAAPALAVHSQGTR